MDNHTLREIIDAEKEIQRLLEQEQEKARRWLEIQKKEAEEEFARGKQQLLTVCEQTRDRDKRKARDNASESVRKAERTAARLAGLSDEVLSRMVFHHLHKILPP